MKGRTLSETAKKARTSPTSDGPLRHRLPAANGHPEAGLSDEAFERLLSRWFDDPIGQGIEVSIKLVCSGLSIRVTDRDAIVAMLRGEQARRRQLREASP